ncbi:MAG: hypothetical protein MZV70_00715 [Desulfobacterales bacterium]|nr:hypothetical protein [Desulfobacterales bacterium]
MRKRLKTPSDAPSPLAQTPAVASGSSTPLAPDSHVEARPQEEANFEHFDHAPVSSG